MFSYDSIKFMYDNDALFLGLDFYLQNGSITQDQYNSIKNDGSDGGQN